MASHGQTLTERFALHDGVQYMNQDDLIALYNANTWRPNLAITGAQGLPSLQTAGNVIRTSTSLRLSMRQSPIVNAEEMKQKIIEKLTTNVPYNAKVTVLSASAGSGWCMKELDEKITKVLDAAGHHFFEGNPTASYGEGGAIPFLKELEGVYPSTQIIALGLGGPYSNAHGPNEGINLTCAKKLACSLALIFTEYGN